MFSLFWGHTVLAYSCYVVCSMFHRLQPGSPRTPDGLLRSTAWSGHPRRTFGRLRRPGHRRPVKPVVRWINWLRWDSPTDVATSSCWRDTAPTCREWSKSWLMRTATTGMPQGIEQSVNTHTCHWDIDLCSSVTRKTSTQARGFCQYKWPRHGSHASWKVLDFSLENSSTWKVLQKSLWSWKVLEIKA